MTDTYLTIANLTGDLVLYRNLEPCDPTLPGLAELAQGLMLAPGTLPRKRDNAYAQIIATLLQEVQQRRSALPLEVLLVVGDTENDRRLAHNLRQIGQQRVFAGIGADQMAADPGTTWDGDTALVTRWALLDAWLEEVERRFDQAGGGLPWQQTALILDIDKTLLGPRGRNADAIDAARAEAALQVAHTVLGAGLDVVAFRQHYATLCEPRFHSLTLDNQDYVTYLALLLVSGASRLELLQRGAAAAADPASSAPPGGAGPPATFGQVLAQAMGHLPAALAATHAEIAAAHQAGDPTPFKAFRQAELVATVARMADGRLRLCSEVVRLAQHLGGQGVLCMAASDKPAESALPTPAQAAAGLLPLHRMRALLD